MRCEETNDENFYSYNGPRMAHINVLPFLIHIVVERPTDWLQVGFIAVKLGSAAEQVSLLCTTETFKKTLLTSRPYINTHRVARAIFLSVTPTR